MFEIGGELALGQWQSETKLFDQLYEDLNRKIQVQIQPNAFKVFVDECSHGCFGSVNLEGHQKPIHESQIPTA